MFKCPMMQEKLKEKVVKAWRERHNLTDLPGFKIANNEPPPPAPVSLPFKPC